MWDIDLSIYPIASSLDESGTPLREYVNEEHPYVQDLDLSVATFAGGIFIANLTMWEELKVQTFGEKKSIDF